MMMPSHRMTPDAEQLQDVRQSAPSPAPAQGTAIETVLPQAEGTARKRALLHAHRIAFLEALIKRSKEPNQMSRAKYEKRLEKLVEKEEKRLNKRKDGTTQSKKRPAKDKKRAKKAVNKLEMIYENDLIQMERILKGPRSIMDDILTIHAWTSDENLRKEIEETIQSYEAAEKMVVKAAENEIALNQDKLAKARELLLKPKIKNEPRTDDPEKTAGSTEIETALPRADEIEPAALAQIAPNKSPESVGIQKFITFFDVLIKKFKKPNRK